MLLLVAALLGYSPDAKCQLTLYILYIYKMIFSMWAD